MSTYILPMGMLSGLEFQGYRIVGCEWFNALVLAMMLALPAADAAGWVRLYTDASHQKKVKRRKLDCRLHRKKCRSLALGFKLSIPFVVSVGPEIKFGSDTEAQWNGISQELVRRYELLCEEHNKGLIALDEYEARRMGLNEFYERAALLKAEMTELVAKRADRAFDELEQELSRREKRTNLEKKVQKLSKRIEELSARVKGQTEGESKGKGIEEQGN